MKKLLLFTAICLFAAAAAVAQQSLGDVARANRASKRSTATTNLTDDNFARSSTPAAESPAKPDAASKHRSTVGRVSDCGTRVRVRPVGEGWPQVKTKKILQQG